MEDGREENDEMTTVQLPMSSRDLLKEEKRPGETYGRTFKRIIGNHRSYKRIKKFMLEEEASKVQVESP